MVESLPLEGLKVIDLADEKGVFCTKLMADLGAEVVKVERPGGGDATRNISPFLNDDPHPEKSLYFAYNNTNKRSVTLNLGMADGREIFKKLVERSDVVVETYRPGYMASLSLDYPNLKKLNSGLVMTSITGFGQTGPYRDFKSPGIISFAMGGLMYLSGEPDMPPLQVGGLQTYYVVSLFAAVAILVALYARDTSGQGQHVDISMQECIAAILERTPLYVYNGYIPRRSGSRHHAAVPCSIYPCKDGYWSLCIGPYSVFWDRFIALVISDGIDVGELSDPEYESPTKRWAELDNKIDPIIRKWGMLHTKAEIFEIGQRNEIAVAPVSNAKDVVEDPHLNALDFYQEVSHPLIGRAKYPGIPWRLPGGSLRVRHAPLIGQHNHEVYGELGLSKQDLIVLREAGVI